MTEKKTPETDKRYTEMSTEDRQTELKTLMGTFTEDEIKNNKDLAKLLGKEEPKPVSEPEPTPKSETKEISESAQLAETMMSEKENSISEIYEDAKALAEPIHAMNLTPFQKLTIMSKVVEPAAKMLKKQKETLMGEKKKGEETETQISQPSSKPEGDKYLKSLISQMGINEKEQEAIGLVTPKSD